MTPYSHASEMSEREETIFAAISQLKPELSDEAVSEIAHLMAPYMRSASPTAAERIRFGIRQIFSGTNEAFERAIGLMDPPDEAFVKPKKHAARRPVSTPAKPTPPSRRHRKATRYEAVEPRNAAQADDVVSNISDTTLALLRELEEAQASAEKYKGIAEENAADALKTRKLGEQVERLQVLRVQTEEEIAELGHALVKAEARAEENVGLALEAVGLKEQIRNLQAQLREAETTIEELRQASEEPRLLVEHFARLAEMEKKLRIRAEGEAQGLQQTIDITEAELGAELAELIEIVQSMLKRAKEGTAKTDAKNDREREEMAARVTKLSEELSREKTLREQAELKAQAVTKSETEMASLRTELEEAREAERQARLQAEKAGQEAEKASAQAKRNIGAAAKVIELTHQLRSAQESERQAQEKAEELREIAREAVEEGRKNAEAVLEARRLRKETTGLKRELGAKNRAFENHSRAFNSATIGIGRIPTTIPEQVRYSMRELKAKNAAFEDHTRAFDNATAGLDGTPDSPFYDLPDEVRDAFITLHLTPPSSPAELKQSYAEWVHIVHSDHTRQFNMEKEGDERFKVISKAHKILKEHFEEQGSQRQTA